MSLRLKFSTGSQITDLNQGQWDDVAGGGGSDSKFRVRFMLYVFII